MDYHGNNEAVDTEHSSHHNGNDITHDKTRVHYPHRRNADTRLCGSIGGTDVREHESRSHSHEPKEGSGCRAGFILHVSPVSEEGAREVRRVAARKVENKTSDLRHERLKEEEPEASSYMRR